MAKRGLGQHSAIAAALSRPKGKKKTGRTTVSISPEVANRLRDCAHFERVSVVTLAEEAILAEVARREAQQQAQLGAAFVYPPRPPR